MGLPYVQLERMREVQRKEGLVKGWRCWLGRAKYLIKGIVERVLLY